MSYNKFKAECASNIEDQAKDKTLKRLSNDWFALANSYSYSYNFEFLGRPLIQYPQDIVQFQECCYEAKPNLIIETGIAHGGSLILSASLLCLLDIMEGKDPRESSRKVVGIDIDIRDHNKIALENHPLFFKIKLIEGSSIDPNVVAEVHDIAKDYERKLICLDSNHTHHHVLSELNSYANLTSIGSYCIVFDTVIEDLPQNSFPNRPWDKGDNPKTAVREWLHENNGFEISSQFDSKLLISVAPNGYLKRVS
jgi:cephalosporin hydroxylase